MARTDTLPHFLTDVADAIRTKKGSEDTITASNFDTEITNLPSGADLSDYFITEYDGTGGAGLIKKVPNITISDGWENISGMFEAFENATELELTFDDDISGFLGLNNVCAYCSNLTSFTINGNFDFSEVLYTDEMFAGCHSLTELDLSMLHCSSLESAYNMFSDCTSLELLDVRNIDFTTLQSYDGMFGSDSETFNADCVIVVADATQKDWVETNFDYLTGVVTVAEYEAE